MLIRTARVVIVGVIALGLSACGDDEPQKRAAQPTTTSATATSTADAQEEATQAVAWMERFCGAVNRLVDDVTRFAEGIEEGSVVDQQSLRKDLGKYDAMLAKAVKALKKLDPGPVPAAEKARKEYLGRYTAAHRAVVKAKKELDAASSRDIGAQDTAVDAMMTTQRNALEKIDAVSGLLDSPEMLDAAASAPECTRI